MDVLLYILLLIVGIAFAMAIPVFIALAYARFFVILYRRFFGEDIFK